MVSRLAHFAASISCIYRYIQKIERDEMIKYGLKGPHAQYLIAMSRYEDGVTAAQLCSICEKDKAAVSRAISELEQKGLVIRTGESNTGYRAPLKLTRKGAEAAAHVHRQAEIAVEKAGVGLNDKNRAIFYSVLNLIASNLQQLSIEGITER